MDKGDAKMYLRDWREWEQEMEREHGWPGEARPVRAEPLIYDVEPLPDDLDVEGRDEWLEADGLEDFEEGFLQGYEEAALL